MQVDYLSGFGNYFESEVEKGLLPIGRNSPQNVSSGLYAEQLSGSAFTALNHENKRSWLYRILPSVVHPPFTNFSLPHWIDAESKNLEVTPNQLRWSPFNDSGINKNFIEGIFSFCANTKTGGQHGSAAHLYSCKNSMKEICFFNSDAEMLILPQMGKLLFRTEFGNLEVSVGELVVIPRGIRFSVDLLEGFARGYVCENFGMPFQLPYRGPIGANGLANGRDFLYPTALLNSDLTHCQVIQKFGGKFFITELNYSPFNVAAWHGNYAPYKYDLARFNTINTVSFDHPDPSIFTVLTSPSSQHGVANVDFAIFPPRWMVAEDTFRPPWYHRNIMSEFMGLIYGEYDAKPGDEFSPGGASLHNCMNAHGPDTTAFKKASTAKLTPHKLENTLAFMFESSLPYLPTKQALKRPELDQKYASCWQGLIAHYKS